MKFGLWSFVLGVVLCLFSMRGAAAGGSGDPTPITNKDGRYLDKDGTPTFKIQPDGTVDWYTYSGFRRYHSECHVCHGPDGEGSTYAPALKDTLKIMKHQDFLTLVAVGRENVSTAQSNVMPALGKNMNVVCYLDDIYVYLRARAHNAIGRGRPLKHEDKSEMAAKAERSCRGLN
jgi:methanol metabolism-related c-type cytochrome